MPYAPCAGAVYVYEKSKAGSWELKEEIKPPNQTGQGFGCSLSISGNQLVIGAQTPASAFVYEAGPGR